MNALNALLPLSLSPSLPPGPPRFSLFSTTLCHAVHPSLCSFGRVCVYGLIAIFKNHRRPEVLSGILVGSVVEASLACVFDKIRVTTHDKHKPQNMYV